MKEGQSVSVAQLLMPISLMAFTLCVLFAFQMTQVMRDRDALVAMKTQQETNYQESIKLQTQVTALVTGTQGLADKGNPNAKTVVEKLIQLGVIAAPQAAGAVPPVSSQNPPVPAK